MRCQTAPVCSVNITVRSTTTDREPERRHSVNGSQIRYRLTAVVVVLSRSTHLLLH
jgi:hypothetical protein